MRDSLLNLVHFSRNFNFFPLFRSHNLLSAYSSNYDNSIRHEHLRYQNAEYLNKIFRLDAKINFVHTLHCSTPSSYIDGLVFFNLIKIIIFIDFNPFYDIKDGISKMPKSRGSFVASATKLFCYDRQIHFIIYSS